VTKPRQSLARRSKPNLTGAALIGRALAKRGAEDALNRVDWLPPQLAFLQCRSKVKLFRTGNQLGKSWAGLWECIALATGKHPWQRGRVCKRIWVVCASFMQSIEIQTKLWELVPKADVHPSQKYDDVKGFGGHNPTLRFKNGSYIRIKTSAQGGLNLSSATLDHVLFDEPPASARVFGEVLKRVQAKGGTLSLTLTPINAPCEWLKELCEKGKIEDLHFPLTVENLTHTRSGLLRRRDDGRICDASWIAEVRSEALPWEEPIVCDGEWEGRGTDRMFVSFEPKLHVSEDLPPGEMLLCIGVDHGTATGKQAGVVVLVGNGEDGHPYVHVWDEYRPEGATAPEQDGPELVHMLARHDWTWEQVDYAYGDRPVGSRDSADRKGNLDIEDAIVAELKRRGSKIRSRESLRPRLASAKRGTGAGNNTLEPGIRWLHKQMLRPGHFKVHPRCKAVIESLLKWKGDKADPQKDLIDAIRYALIPWIRGEHARRRTGPAPKIKAW